MSDPNGPYAGGPQGPPFGGPPGPGPEGPWPGPPVQSYGYQPYGYAVDHPQGTTVLVLGILSIVFCQICGPFAWAMGRRALADIDAQPGRYGNRGTVQAGYICGIVGSVLLGFYLVFGVIYVFVIFAAIGSSA